MTYWIQTDEWVAELESDSPLRKEFLDDLESAINDYDCEEWSAKVGHSIIARLRRITEEADR